MSDSSSLLTARRRGFVGALAAGAAAGTGGCLRRARSIAGWQSREQVSLQIKTLPADADPYALWIARSVAGWFGDAGIDVSVVPMAKEELLRQVLLNNDFDVFVTTLPTQRRTPDSLYALLHSRFAETSGWQNPFGFADFDVDDLLDTQRRETGARRRTALADLQRSLARSQPFTVVAFPDDIRTARIGAYRNWQTVDLRTPQGYLNLERNAREEGADTVLRIASTDGRPTENLNPLAVEHRREGLLTGLLYDALGIEVGGERVPWLAASWEFERAGGRPRATVRLREDVRWHDGEALTAEDVAFTYALLADTTMGDSTEPTDTTDREPRVPAPRLQGRRELVESIAAVDDRTLTVQFGECSDRVATRAFTIPILPKHVWKDRTDTASISNIEVGSASEALVTDNVPPVGSGPLEYVENTPEERLVLESVDDHFSTRVDDAPAVPVGPPVFDRLVLQAVGSDDTAVALVAEGEADLTGTSVAASTVPRIGRSSDLELIVRRATAPYVLGYNVRRPPLTNPRFRNTLAYLVDQAHLVDDVFDGYARAAVSPLTGTDWLPDDLRWEDENPVTPFLGVDGEVDVAEARDAFREAGYQYEDGRLVGGN